MILRCVQSCFLLLPLLCLCALPVRPAHADLSIPRHQIAISFDIEHARVEGSSRIIIPPGNPLHLDCGTLQITGQLLEQGEKTPQTLHLAEDNTLAIPASTLQQTVTLSWRMTVRSGGEDDNLISNQGITLTGFWHPLADADMLFSLEAKIPRHFEAICEADTMRTEAASGNKRFIAAHTQPLRSLHFAAGPYHVQTKQLAHLTLATYVFKEDEALAGRYLTKAAQAIERFEQLLGPFPFDRFAIVENRLPTGYGFSTFTLLGQQVMRLPFIPDTSLAHEIVHSWFGNSVRVNDTGGNWCEGLTTYLADHATAVAGKQGQAYRQSLLIRYGAYVHAANALPVQAFTGAADHQLTAKSVRAVGYDKSAMIFHMVRNRIGPEPFLEGVRALYQNMHGKKASWNDIEGFFSARSGQDLHAFFQQWLSRTDIPKLALEKVKIDQQGGRAILSFELVQDTLPPFDLDVPVRITTLTGDATRVLRTRSAREPFRLELDSLPTSLVIDDQFDLMRALDPAERPPTWSQFLGAEKKTIVMPENGAEQDRFQPLINHLRPLGSTVVDEGRVKNSMLAQGSWLFLGDSAHRRNLFAEPHKTRAGFTFDVRRSPFDPSAVMVLADSSSVEETGLATNKLDHYSSYSTVQFVAGRNTSKITAPATQGIESPLIAKPRGFPRQAVQDFDQIIEVLANNRVVYAGETHTDYGSHLLQLQIIQALYGRGKPLMIGLEMFPRSSQQALDDYIQGTIDERSFIKASNYFTVWGYDYRLYRDIFQYARSQQIPLIGLNMDKGITSQVNAEGSTDGLTPQQRAQIPNERDLDMPGYRQRLQRVHDQHGATHHTGFSGFLQAQALWDETMADSVAVAVEKFPDRLMIVLAGNGHIDTTNGIPPRVERRLPGISQQTVLAGGIAETANGQADFLMETQAMELTEAAILGVSVEKAAGEQADGLRISAISGHGFAERAGIASGDWIVAINDAPVESLADIRISLLDKKPGEIVQVRIRRDEKQMTVPVELSSAMVKAALPFSHPKN